MMLPPSDMISTLQTVFTHSIYFYLTIVLIIFGISPYLYFYNCDRLRENRAQRGVRNIEKNTSSSEEQEIGINTVLTNTQF